jgi:PBP1b-binding outer membrane lipoprotein LpoB
MMKIKVLAVLGLAAFMFLTGCRGGSNTNANATNANANMTATATPTPVVKTTEATNTYPNLKPKIEAALKAKGFKDVTVDMTTPKMTIRGTVPKGKLGDVMATVMEANGGKPVDNQVTEK